MNMLSNAALNLKNLWSNGDEEYDEYEADEAEAAPSPGPSSSPSSKYSPEKYSSPKSYSTTAPAPTYGGGAGRGRTLRSVPMTLRAQDKNIYTLRPANLEEAALAADHLKIGSAIVLNLESIERAISTRIIDFMSGVCYGLENQGHAMKLGDAIFMFTPGEFEISSDELDYGENQDCFFKEEGANTPSATTTATAAPAQTAAPKPAPTSSNGGYATADYAGSHYSSAASSTAPKPSVASAGAPQDYDAPRAATSAPVSAQSTHPTRTRTTTLPSSSLYSSSGKAHVIVAERTPQSAAPSTGASLSERRSWER